MSKIKQLQNHFTTPEQSKRLLELGVPEWTANCVLRHYNLADDNLNENNWELPCIVWSATELDRFIDDEYDKVLPCWSVGRLIEIAHICSDSTLSYKEEANEIQKFKEEHKCETLIEAVIVCIADAVSIGSINFSKLED